MSRIGVLKRPTRVWLGLPAEYGDRDTAKAGLKLQNEKKRYRSIKQIKNVDVKKVNNVVPVRRRSIEEEEKR